jgi:hypothetical protein
MEDRAEGTKDQIGTKEGFINMIFVLLARVRRAIRKVCKAIEIFMAKLSAFLEGIEKPDYQPIREDQIEMVGVTLIEQFLHLGFDTPAPFWAMSGWVEGQREHTSPELIARRGRMLRQAV